MEQLKTFKYTWQMFEEDIQTIKTHIDFTKFDVIIGLASGGLPLLTKLHNVTKLPYETVKCSSYDGVNKKFLSIESGVTFIDSRRILIVDDVTDTGDTLKKVIAHCKDISIEGVDIKTLTLCCKPHADFVPDWYLHRVDDDMWINFPWE